MYDQQLSQVMNQQFNVDQVAFQTESMQDTMNTVSQLVDLPKISKFHFLTKVSFCLLITTYFERIVSFGPQKVSFANQTVCYLCISDECFKRGECGVEGPDEGIEYE